MSSSFQFKFLKNVKKEEFLEVFNNATSEFFVPTTLTKDQLGEKIKTEGIDLSLSVGAYHQKKLVGFILHAKNNKKLYNAGTGVLSDFRGNNLTAKMYDYAIPLFKSFQMDKVSLEVDSSNESAMRTYRKIGFKKWRTVESLKGRTRIKVKDNLHNALTMGDLPYYEYLVSYIEKDLIPTWQNNEFCINNNDRVVMRKKVMLDKTTIGYIIYNPIEKRLLQIWVKDTYRRKGIASFMMHEVFGNNVSFYVTNIDGQNFGIHSFFRSIGAESYQEQVEMELYLS
ncbi:MULTISPECIES: GNAT family N-acetyltransferase [Myroides]|uniref:GNAT family N-acetyltransferase n=1 Tax=Myroides TaxID=76831 RepID=UPI0013035DC8|nr:GNAT family N-acetyltransferase [Myroides phaeus]